MRAGVHGIGSLELPRKVVPCPSRRGLCWESLAPTIQAEYDTYGYRAQPSGIWSVFKVLCTNTECIDVSSPAPTPRLRTSTVALARRFSDLLGVRRRRPRNGTGGCVECGRKTKGSGRRCWQQWFGGAGAWRHGGPGLGHRTIGQRARGSAVGVSADLGFFTLLARRLNFTPSL